MFLSDVTAAQQIHKVIIKAQRANTQKRSQSCTKNVGWREIIVAFLLHRETAKAKELIRG